MGVVVWAVGSAYEPVDVLYSWAALVCKTGGILLLEKVLRSGEKERALGEEVRLLLLVKIA